jgi:hypothetical protein
MLNHDIKQQFYQILCEFETWSFIVMEEQRLKLQVSANEMSWRIFVSSKSELRGEW